MSVLCFVFGAPAFLQCVELWRLGERIVVLIPALECSYLLVNGVLLILC